LTRGNTSFTTRSAHNDHTNARARCDCSGPRAAATQQRRVARENTPTVSPT
jgi:hypothetical protein